MNENKFLREIYTGNLDLKAYDIDALRSEIDFTRIHYGDESCTISIEEEDDSYELVFDFGKYNDGDYIYEILSEHLNEGKELEKKISEFDDSVEHLYRFSEAESKKVIEYLENALKEIFELDYIEQTPHQLKRTLIKDREMMEKIIEKRISKGADEDVFDFNVREHYPIHIDNDRLTVRLPGDKEEIMAALNDYAKDNRYGLEIKEDEDFLKDKYAEIRGNKNFEAGDVIGLLKKMTFYWEEPWNRFPLRQIEPKSVKSIQPKPETILTSQYSPEARTLAKMMGTLPKTRVKKVLDKFSFDLQSRQAKNIVEVTFKDNEDTYTQNVKIIRNRWSTEFRIDTDNEKIADKALIALSQALMPEIEQYNKTRRNRYWEEPN
ncbi:MAG: hypothetical protein KAJ56_01560 [Candidatus Aenigmarchaeota archaeon]|nr:hypothetical protein [Candidatus Aenigmarchaeota archaeon]